MLTLPTEDVSLWRESAPRVTFPPVDSDAAYLLSQAGRSVAVLEKDSIGSGTTGHTTGKVSSQHGLVYNDLNLRFGEKIARLYGQSNQKAIDSIKAIIEKESIDCGWRDDDNYVFVADKQRVNELKAEAKIARILGLPASFEKNTPLPFKIEAAVKFTGQGMFNAQKYIQGLAKAVLQKNKQNVLLESSRAGRIEDGAPCITHSKGHKIISKAIVVATNVPTFPLMARVGYCFTEYPHTSYIVVCEYSGGLEGMYISPDENHYSILPVKNGSKPLLYIGGANHIPGLHRASSRYKKLIKYGQEMFGIKSVDYKWHARDYIAYDGLPVVGKIYPWSKSLYTATAFKKWGLTQSYVAASILRDAILGEKNNLADIYSPHRLSPIKSIPQVIAKELGIKS
jgi:glycine/D-amino acid oxidase-like deaminating enzyme